MRQLAEKGLQTNFLCMVVHVLVCYRCNLTGSSEAICPLQFELLLCRATYGIPLYLSLVT
jgi:hypothetical protein